MQYEIDANAAKFKLYERQKSGSQAGQRLVRTLGKQARDTCVAAATPPDAAGERFMLPRDLLGQTATQRSAACEPLRTSGRER